MRQRGFSVPELLAALAVGLVLALLAFPLLSRMTDAGKQATCLAHLRQYGMACVALITEKQGLPWWDGLAQKQMAPDSVYPDMPEWLKQGGYLADTSALRCPKASREDRKRTSGMNYGFNTAFNIYYPKSPFSIPAPYNRVALAVENYGNHFNIPGHLNRTIWANDDGQANPATEGSAKLWPNPQYHGTSENRGLHFLFLDGHAELLYPVANDWRKEPTYGAADNRGYIYDRDQMRRIRNGTLLLR